MAIGRIIGLCCLALGIMLVLFGMSAADAPLEEISKTFTGRYSEQTTLYLIGGVVAMVAGGALMLFGGKSPNT
jgi:hypothetical protein